MSYYEDRKRAILMIDDMLSQGMSPIVIKHKISVVFGFSDKLVDQRIAHLKELNLCQP